MNLPAARENRPRVLFLTKVHPYPPATAGDAVYSRGLIEAFSLTCRLTVLCADSDAVRGEGQNIDWHIVGKQRAGQAGSIISQLPLIAWKGATRDYVERLDSLLRMEWDAIVLDNLGLAHALGKAKRYRARNPEAKLIYISHEFEYLTRSAKYNSYDMPAIKRFAAKVDLEKVRRSEEALVRDCDIVTVINLADLKPFRKMSSSAKFLPLIPGYSGPIVSSREITAETPRRILLLGGRRSEQKRQILLDWMEVSYARLTKEGVETVIVGDMDESLKEQLSKLYPAARILGFVDDLGALVGSARMGVVADTVGGGFKMRLLSHIFERLPIIGLTGAVSGLPTPEGAGWLGAESLPELVDLVSSVVDNTELLNSLHNTAFIDSASAFGWQKRAEDFRLALSKHSDSVLV